MNGPFSSVWLYGSWARGDQDAWSDLDILLVDRTLLEAAPLLGQFPHDRISVSQYASHDIEMMAQKGSLFLHHLESEGRVLELSSGADELRHRLERLPEYMDAGQDLHAFCVVAQDVRNQVQAFDPSVAFEYGLLGSTFRHLSVLATYLMGEPTFGRSSILRVGQLLGLEQRAVTAMERAYWFHMTVQRSHPISTPIPSRSELLDATYLIDRVAALCGHEGSHNV